MHRSLIFGVGVTLALAGIAPSAGHPACRPKLAVTGAQFSEMIPPTLQRKWTAVVSVDASACAAGSTGDFYIVFTRLSDTAPDLEFRERFVWRSPLVRVGLDLSADEAVGRYRIENVRTCVCREQARVP